MEIEKKYQITDAAAFDRLAALDTLGAYDLRQEAAPQQQHNTYYDTADGSLTARRYGLRIRKVGTQSIATLKGPGTAQDGLFRREEWETEANDPHPTTWPAGEARDAALDVVGEVPVYPILTIQTQRRHIYAVRDGSDVAEFSLDDVTLFAGEQQDHYTELEIEILPDGSEADLAALETALREHVALVPENRSKLQRGMELLHATSGER